MNIQHVDLVAGEDRTITFNARDHRQGVLNITGGTIGWKLARSNGCAAALEKTGSIVSGADGTFTVALTDSDTSWLRGEYIHEAKVTVAGVTTVAARGRFRVREAVGGT